MIDEEKDTEPVTEAIQEDVLEGDDISILNSLMGYGSSWLLQLWGILGDGKTMEFSWSGRDYALKGDESLLERDALLRQHTQNMLVTKHRMERCYGPFKVLERVGKVAYRLALPDSSKIHLVFHVSLLKAFSRIDEEQVANLPEDEHEGQPVEQPLSGRPPEESTWEWLLELKIAYPSYHLEDKIIFEGDKNDTPTPELMAERPKREKSKPGAHN
uniref:Tf2-1-like SH3-like domain-containing protein n=1 Tax=Tanacetum cinerariifolium TaxID=118510 RepID=A0A6L2MMR1_TANCI|nr:hypothetical protein [Tanacetum cinerariifolium]GEU94536.1 hypothetical protein [Tanacetum cinerariifolium]